MKLSDYINGLSCESLDSDQINWFCKLKATVRIGEEIYKKSSEEKRRLLKEEFRNWVRTEELKAWYGAPDGKSLFQGTSVSSLTIPFETSVPIHLKCIEELEDLIADSYIRLHDKHEKSVRNANIENVDTWIEGGLYYGIVIASKVISQSFNLVVPQDSIIFPVEGTVVDPHEILSYTTQIRKKYFEICKTKINCFEDLCPTQTEIEESLILADISKPKIHEYKDKLLLGPIRCNEICTLISRNVTVKIKEKTNGRITPRSLMVAIYDSDTPYTYHQIGGGYGHPLFPILPGLTLLGSSGTIDAFRWLYIYRVSLIAQKMMKSSLYSETEKNYIPFIFFGVLVKRDADILLNMNDLGKLRYRGCISPHIEFCYLLSQIDERLQSIYDRSFNEELENRAR